jgi:hypothetical protein
MGRLAWSQVWFRPARALALILGLLAAAALLPAALLRSLPARLLAEE